MFGSSYFNSNSPLKLAALMFIACAAFGARAAQALSATTLFPANNATAVPRDVNPRIVFDATPVKGTSGAIRIYRASDDLLVKQIDAVNPTSGTPNADVANKAIGDGRLVNYYPIIIQGSTVLIDPTNSILAYNTTYYVQIDATVFTGYAGIADTTSWRFTTKPVAPTIGTDIFVNANGSGDFCTVQGAIDAISGSTARTIHIAAGSYEEELVCRSKPNLTFLGDDRNSTIIRYATNNTFQGYNGRTAGTDNRPMFALQSDGTTLRNLTFWNTTPVNGSQAETIRIKTSDKIVVRDCNFKSYQDTVLADGRVYFWNCYIEGDVDYIWGSGGNVTNGIGGVFFDRCQIHTLRNGYLVQARNNVGGQVTVAGNKFGYVFNECTLTAEPGVTSLYFNRVDPTPFPFSSVIMINCTTDSFMNSAGWLLNNTSAAPTAAFWEYHSIDPQGRPISITSRLATYSRQLTDAEAATLRDPNYILRGTDNWAPKISQTFETSPIGWASINDHGQNGTTGGTGGTVTTVTTQAALDSQCSDAVTRIIQVQGTITMSPFGHHSTVNSNKTIIGLGSDATIVGGGLSADGEQNIIIQNLTIRDGYEHGNYDGKINDNDGIALRDTHHVWIDHCFISHMGDGLIDATTDCDNITASWNVLSFDNKSMGMGVGDPDPERITMHHNWIINNNQRNSRNEGVRMHHFNNYWSGIGFYCNNSKTNAQVLIENSYFKNASNPQIEEEGPIRAAGNIYYGTTGSINNTGTTATVTNPPYAYTLDPAGIVPTMVRAGAGPGGGGIYTDNHFTKLKINFQPSSQTASYGYYEDNGATYASRGFNNSFGWDATNTANSFWRTNLNSDSTAQAPTDEELRRNGGISFGNGARTWELGVHNGTYQLTIACGDPYGGTPGANATGGAGAWAHLTATNSIDVEGSTLTDTDPGDAYDDFSVIANVADGKLTIKQAAGGSDARIAFIEIMDITATDSVAPTPNPSTWAVTPHATGTTSIAMTATTATDTYGVQYYFANITNPAHDSGWQTSPSFTDTGLGVATSYTYTVKSRDYVLTPNVATESAQQSATTDSPPDTTTPTPNPATFAVDPHAVGSTHIEMTATTASDANGVEYYFANITSPAHDSGWQASASFTDAGLTASTSYTYTVKVRDQSSNHNETAASGQESATTAAANAVHDSAWRIYE